MIDTHTHIYLEEFEEDRDEVVKRAKGAGVKHLIFPNVDLETIAPMHQLHAKYADYTSMAMGLHPTSVNEDYRCDLDKILKYFDECRYVAVGEIGIDLYWDKKYRKEQGVVFKEQIEFADSKGLPIIIHVRDGLGDVLSVFSQMGGRIPRGVFHSFTGSVDDVKRIREYGDFYFGINGIVTFKKSEIPSVLPEIGIDRLLLETDSPYLTPVPNRGKRNESANIPYICKSIATHLNLMEEDVSRVTDENAKALFKI